jgi:hypothetical protein
LDQSMAAARFVARGINPYDAIGPGRQWDAPFRLYYPAPAIVVAFPFAMLPLMLGRALFCGLGMAAFAFALLRYRPHCWPMLLSYPALATVAVVQWVPWLAAATMLPWLGAFAAAKPNIGVAVGVAQRGWREFAIATGGTIVLTGLSFALLPSWPVDWFEATRSATHVRSLVLRPLGFVLLLAALRWRIPEGRALLALALVPMTPGPQEGLLLAGVAETRKQALILAIISHAMLPVAQSVLYMPTFVEVADRLSWGVLAFIYVPVLIVLLRRPHTQHV